MHYKNTRITYILYAKYIILSIKVILEKYDFTVFETDIILK